MPRPHPFAGFAAVVAVGLSGCTREPTAAPANAPALAPATAAPVSVKVVTPKRQTLSWSVEQPGSVMAFETTPVVAKLSGYVSNVHVDLGDRVSGPTATEPGALLAEVSIPELVQEANQKAALVEQAAAEVVQAVRGAESAAEQIRVAEAMVAEAKAVSARVTADIERWSSELKRIEGLVGGRVVDSQTLDETRKQYKTAAAAKDEMDAKVASAAAAVREAKAKKGRADADVLAAEAHQRVAAADAERTKALLGYTKIRAPFAGVITARHVHTGHFLQPTGAKAEPLFVIARTDTLRVAVEVPEAATGQTKAGTPVVVRFPALGGREVAATVARTAGVLSPDSRTLRVEIDLPNADGSLKPGLFATVKVAATSPDALTVPAAAVLFADETAYCFVVKDGKAAKQRVRTGRTDGGNVEVLGKRPAGVTTGDWAAFDGAEKVVIGNLGALADGQLVSETGP
jgi:RND family efflux transporter MFP subunit